MRVLSKNVERDVPSHLTWLSDSMIQPHTSLQCFQVSLLCPLSSTISSPLPGPINMSHPGLSGSNFGASPNVISWGENGICVWEKHSAAGSVRESFFSLFLSASHVRGYRFPLSLSASPRDRSICIRPQKEFSDSCLQLFSLPGCDCKSPQAPGTGSRFFSSLSTQLLVTCPSISNLI